MSRLRLSYRSKAPPLSPLINQESRAILVKIVVPSEGITKTLLINTTSLISDLREKLQAKLKTQFNGSFAFFWNKENDQLWLDDKVSLKAYHFKDGELVEFKQRPKDWRPVIKTKNIGPWVKGAPKSSANYLHQLDKSTTSIYTNSNLFQALQDQPANQSYVENNEKDRVVEDIGFTNTRNNNEDDNNNNTVKSNIDDFNPDNIIETFDEILASLNKSEEAIKRKSRTSRTSLVPLYLPLKARRSSNASTQMLHKNQQNSVKSDEGVDSNLQEVLEDYAKRLKETNDLLWIIVNGIDSNSIDAKKIRRLAKKGIQHCTIVNND